MPKFSKNLKRVEQAFDRNLLAETCIRPEADFGAHYDMRRVDIDTEHDRWRDAGDSFYFYKDNGSSVLAVAHLDTVADAATRTARFVDTEAGPVVFSRALDDRLGAYTILELLPALGIQYDLLLTVGEESGQSTAQFFDTKNEYDWMIEFDRGGTDVVMYQYDDAVTRSAVRQTGAMVGDGIFSDVCYLEHLGIKGFNWGVGYRDYHGPKAHAYLDDYFAMVARYLKFHQLNEGIYFPHTPQRNSHYRGMSPIKWDDDDLAWWDSEPGAELAVDPDVFDPDYVSDNPTLEELQRLEERLDREREERGREVTEDSDLVRLDKDWIDSVLASGKQVGGKRVG